MASEYGWTSDYIRNNVYLDEAYRWIDMIGKRKLTNYQTLLAISHNPHVEKPETLWDLFKGKGTDSRTSNTNDAPDDNVLDKSMFERLKGVMSANPKMIVK